MPQPWKRAVPPTTEARKPSTAEARVPSTTEARVPLAAAPFSAHPRQNRPQRHPLQWWGGEDLNPRRRTPADLQSAPFGHLGTSPNPPAAPGNSSKKLALREDLNPRPTAYKAVALPLSYASTDKRSH